MKILILGSKGQLGTALCNIFENKNIQFSGVDLPEFDITNEYNLREVIDQKNPEIIINACAYTNVKAAEYEFAQAVLINGICLKKLVELCNKKDIYLCHISTDYVFDGQNDKPYIEEDTTNPINCYGFSKELGEKIVRYYSKNYVIVRTAALYGNSKIHSENVVDKIIQSAKMINEISLVDDEYTSPTFAEDLARQIHVFLENKVKGIVHATSEGECNWHEFGTFILQTLDMEVAIKKVKSQDFSGLFKKPHYSVLENSRLNLLKMNVMPHWKVSLGKYLEVNYKI